MEKSKVEEVGSPPGKLAKTDYAKVLYGTVHYGVIPGAIVTVAVEKLATVPFFADIPKDVTTAAAWVVIGFFYNLAKKWFQNTRK